MRSLAIAALVAALGLGASGQVFTASGLPGGSLVRGVPPSVTSIGASHSGNIPPSVTSLRSVPLCCNRRGEPFRASRTPFGFAPVFFAPFAPIGYPSMVPLVYDTAMDPLVAPEDVAKLERQVRDARQADYDSGFNAGYARAARESNYRAQAQQTPAPTRPAAAAPPSEAPKPLPATVLIFRDGHKLEIQNYAITGATLYNLSDSAPHKIALDDLDLDATTKANSDRGIPFRLPKRS